MRVGDLFVMGEGPGHYPTPAEQVACRGVDYVGVSTYLLTQTEAGLQIADHRWVGYL